MHCYVQAPRHMIGELWLRTMARINWTRYIRDTCSTHTCPIDRKVFWILLQSDVLCPRIPGILTEIKREGEKRKKNKENVTFHLSLETFRAIARMEKQFTSEKLINPRRTMSGFISARR